MLHYISKIYTSIALFRAAFYNYKKTILVLIGLGFMSGILGGIGIGAVIPLFSFISRDNGSIDDPISNIFHKIFSVLGISFSLPTVILVIVIIFLFKAVFIYIANFVNTRAVIKYELETRRELFRQTILANWPYLLDRKIGYLSQMITDDVIRSANLLMSLTMIILAMTSLISYAAIAFKISFNITIVTLLIGILVFFFLKPLFYKLRKLSKRSSLISKDVSHHINEYLLGAKTVKSMAIEDKIIDKGNMYFQELANSKLSSEKYSIILGTFLEPLTLVIVIPVFLFSYQDPNFNIATFAAILYLIQKMFAFLQSILSKASKVSEGIPYLVSVVKYQAEANEYREQLDTGKDFKFQSLLKFENVDFNYVDNKEQVLADLNFAIKKGEMVGLIGHSGSGKTTVVDLALRLFNPVKGRITADEVDIADINLKNWRKNIGYVSQDIFLINDTIANNIRFYDDSISDDDILRAVKLANIYDFIIQQPEKFNTFVGERGLKLSVGQRQRIVLARVLARNPHILILDEATSALDNESELLIQKAIESLKGKITILAIAHRFSTIMNSDRLLILDGGKIIEEGSPDGLLKNHNSHFFKIYNITNV